MKTYWLTLALSEDEVKEHLEECGGEEIAVLRDFGEVVSLKEVEE